MFELVLDGSKALTYDAAMETLSRRSFIQATAGAAALGLASPGAGAQRDAGFRGSLCFFSKHLPRMNGRELGRSLKALGFDGVDLTVRPGGHVDPKRVAADLPVFVDAIRHEGLTVPMISTELLSDADPVAQPTLETAARLKIPFYKAGYYRYKFVDVRKELEAAGAQLRGLADLSRRHGMRVGYHNHAGYIGGPVWDFAPFIERLDAATVGYYFDPPSCGGRRRRRRVAHGVRPGGAAAVDDLAQGLLLGKERRLVAAAELPHGRGHGRLETVLRHARESAFQRSSVASCGIRGHRHHARGGAGEHVGRGRTRFRVRQGSHRRSLFRSTI